MSILNQLKELGLENIGEVWADLTTPQLHEEIIKNREGRLAHLGALVVRTGHFAERSPWDTFVVSRPELEGRQWVAGLFRPMTPETFDQLWSMVRTYLHNRDIYVQDVYAAGGQSRRVELRVVSEMAWHSLYARTLWWPRSHLPAAAVIGKPFTIVHVPRFQAIPERDGTGSSSFAALDPTARIALIGGTAYGGELRAMVASICRLAHSGEEGLLPLRCAVNVGEGGDVAAFLGRTGNGKTTLAAGAGRTLLGDHEHGWTSEGLFAYDRGVYARALELSRARSPELHEATRRFGALLENVTLDQETRRLDYNDRRLTDNTRAAFPAAHLARYDRSAACGHPKHIFLLTRDTLGVLPPIARMTPDQAVFSFLTGYVASLSETEAQPGDIRPEAEKRPLSLPPAALRPEAYAKSFLEKILRHEVQCWFVNTGWVGEPQGRGERFDLDVSKALVRAALAGELDGVPYEKDPLFLFEVPKSCPGVDEKLLDPRGQAADQGDYELRANRLALDFIEGFKRFEVDMPESVREMVASVPLLDTDLDIMDQVGFSI